MEIHWRYYLTASIGGLSFKHPQFEAKPTELYHSHGVFVTAWEWFCKELVSLVHVAYSWVCILCLRGNLVSGDHLCWCILPPSPRYWALPWWRLQSHKRLLFTVVCGTCKWRFRHTPTQMEECTQYSAASFISWTWKLAVLIDWLNICLHLWLIAFWFIDWLILHLLLHWLILHSLIDWIGIGIYWLIWIGIWWRLCTCAYPVHNSPTLGRHNWLIDWLLWGAALR